MSIHSSHDRFYGVPIRSCVTLPNDDAQGVSEKMIRAVVVEFYRRARRDAQLGPIFDAHIADWTEHLDRMTDFWSACASENRPLHRQPGGKSSSRVLAGGRALRSLDHPV